MTHAPAQSKTHPLAGQTLTGAEVVVQVLADEGVGTVFGYSGGAILPTYDAIFRYNQERVGRDDSSPMPLIVPANEQGAGFMAAGYARASGRVGVCLVTSGPGATNTVTPVRDCAADSVPIVVICGQVPTAAIGTDAFQEAPVANIMGAVAKHCFLVTDGERLEALRVDHQKDVLGDRAHDVCNRRLLERVGTDRGRGHLATDHHDGYGVRGAVAHRRHRIRGTGAGGDQAHADASARPRVSRRHERGPLLVCGNDQRHRT